MRPMRGLVVLTVVIVASVMLAAGCWAQATSMGRDLTSQIRDAGPLAILVGVKGVAQPDFAAIPGLTTGAATVTANILAQSLMPFLIPQGSTNPLEDAYENMGKIATQKDIRDKIIKAFQGNLAASTDPLASKVKMTDAQLDGILQSFADEKNREKIIQGAVATIKSTIGKDAAADQQLQQLLAAANIAIAKEYNTEISDDVKAVVPEAKDAKEYGDNFIALGCKVIDDLLKDDRFKNLDKKFLENIVNIAVQTNLLTKNGDLGAFRQGEDRAINNARVGAAKTANIHSQPSAQPTVSQVNWISISKALVVIALAFGILVALVVW